MYIHDPDSTMTFDPKVQFKGFMTWLCVRATDFFSFDIVILCLTRECITMARCVAYIPDLCITLPLITKLYLTAAVAQSVRAFASQAEGLVFESQPRQNGSISVKNSRVGRKTPYKQTHEFDSGKIVFAL